MLRLESRAEMSTTYNAVKLVLVSKVDVRHRPSHAEIWRGKLWPIVILLKNVIVRAITVASLVVSLSSTSDFSCFCFSFQATSFSQLVFVGKSNILIQNVYVGLKES